MRKARTALLILACLVVACGGGLYLREVTSKTLKPARVVVLFSVEGQEGVITDLTATNFTILEDGRQVPNASDWKVSKADLRANHRALLLVDLGGRISPADRTAVANAARVFVDRLRGVGKTAVYAFDGAADPHLITPFSEDVPQEDLDKLDKFEAKDSSTDLHSAYKATHDALVAELKKDTLGVGAMVLVSRGPDRASRMSGSDLLRFIEQSEVRVPRHAVGIGEPTRQADLESLSTEEPVYVAKTADLGKALYDLATWLRTQSTNYYLLSFCSAARAGRHELTIEARRTFREKNGDEIEESGTLSYVFSADGFGAGCDPAATATEEGAGGAGGAGGAPATSASVIPEPAASQPKTEPKAQPKAEPKVEPKPEPKAQKPDPKGGPKPAIPVPDPQGSSK